MASIQSLCDRVMILKNGTVINVGPTDEMISEYLSDYEAQIENIDLKDRIDREGNGELKFLDFWIEDESGKNLVNLVSGLSCFFCVKMRNNSKKKIEGVNVCCRNKQQSKKNTSFK